MTILLNEEITNPNGVVERRITEQTQDGLVLRQTWSYGSVVVDLTETISLHGIRTVVEGVTVSIEAEKEKTVTVSIDGRVIGGLHPAHLGALIRVLSVGSLQGHTEVAEQAEDWPDDES